MAWDKLMVSYSPKDPAKAARIERQLVSQYHRRIVKPGQIVVAMQASAAGGCGCGCGSSSAKPGTLGAKAAWYPGKTGLRVKLQVSDAKFASLSEQQLSRGAAYATILTAAPGTNGNPDGITVLPMGTGGKPRVYGGKAVNAAWKKTKAGYDLDVMIPWDQIKSFKQGTGLLQVQAVVTGRGPDGAAQNVTTGTQGMTAVRGFAVLKLK